MRGLAALPAVSARPAERMKTWLARTLYSGLLRLLTPAFLLRLWWRGRREPGYREALAERLAWDLPAQPPGALWIHAVSLGETRAAAALVAELRQRLPGRPVLLTHGTATGHAAGAALLQPGDRQRWLPYDTPGAVRRFLRAERPVLGVLMETEVWPNLLLAASHAGVPMVLANARLSARSARRGRRLAWLLHPAGQSLALALAQSPADATRLREAGASPVEVLGNLKFDLLPSPQGLALGRAWHAMLGRPLVLAANTREGEEVELLAAWQARRADVADGRSFAAASGAAEPVTPPPLLCIVPRHPQRFDEVAAAIQASGLRLARRSHFARDTPTEDDRAAEVWLGDSLGEMSAYYAAADVALLGGSFQPLGGHNLIEAAACACPIVLGPSTFNFAEAAELALSAGAAWRAVDWGDGLAQADALLADPARREDAAHRATAFAAAHRGAAAHMATRIAALVHHR
jgi:3-deoxy-D-manno-octulosonic-acid transferase